MSPRAATLAFLTALFLAGPGPLRAEEETPRPDAAPGVQARRPAQRPSASRAGVVRVNTTVQAFDFYRPWNKKQPAAMRGIGAVIEGGRVLVSAALVANRTYIEIEKAEDAVKCEASVELLDHEANLALLKPADDRFLDGISPMTVAGGVNVGDPLAVLQLETGGTLAASPGRVTSIELASYPAMETPLLVFKLTVPLQYRDGSHSLPVVDAAGALAGLMLRYEARSQTLEIVPAPVIAHFLADGAKPPYEGFPRAGMRFTPLRDPALRAHLKAPPGDAGVFVESVAPGGAAARAGVRPGDILLKAGAFPIDADGNFDHPKFGELGAAHIFSTEFFAGDVIPLEVMRDGKMLSLSLKAAPRPASAFAVPPHSPDTQPPYLVAGGIVLTELSRAYLNEWGGRWEANAPLTLVYLDRYQDTLIEPGSRVVIISQVLPTDDTIGYEEVRNARVLSVNGIAPKNLREAAAALDSVKEGFHRIEIDTEPGLLVLDAAGLKATDEAVARSYGIPALRRLE